MQAAFVDLSLKLEPSASEPEPVAIEYVSHREGAELLTKKADFSADAFPDGMGINLERISLTSHSGTHVDAPLHYGPKSENAPAKAIDELPLSWFFAPAFLLNCCKETKEPIGGEELQSAIDSLPFEIQQGDIALIYTGADRLWGKEEYFTHFRGMTVEGTEMLLDRGVKVIGIDSFGFDPPFQRMTDLYAQTGNPQALWPCHMLGRRREYCQIERLANLSLLPPDKKFLLSCFPIKLKGCGAAPARVVAIIN